MTRISLFVTFAAALTLGACSSEGDARTIVCDSQQSNNPAARGLCRVWTGKAGDAYVQICAQEGGTEVQSCTAQDRVGLCATDQGFGVGLDYVYYAPAWDATSARQHCENLASCSFTCTFTP